MANYSIYFDETGDFQGNTYQNVVFYAICGFVWKGEASILNTKLKTFCTDLSAWLQQEQKDNGLSFPHNLHTTENHLLANELKGHQLETDLLHNRLKDLPLSVTGIYAFKDEINQEDFEHDSLYWKMLRTLMRRITKKIRKSEPDATITFHIPTRSTVFEINDKKKHEFQQSDIRVNLQPDKETGLFNQSVSLNTPEAFIDISKELNVYCSVRTIDYSTSDPDRSDQEYHRDRNTESTAWGYYTADIINYWIRTFAQDNQKDPLTIESDINNLLDVFLLLPFSKEIEAAHQALSQIHDNPCNYLDTLEKIYAIVSPTPRTQYAIDLLEKSNPFSDPDNIYNAGRQIDREYIFQSKYTKAKALLERAKTLSDKTESKGSRYYCDMIAKLMTCYHHEGGNETAQELFNTVKSALGNDRARTMDICNKYQEIFVNTLAFEQGISFVTDVLDSFKPVSTAINVGGISISGAETSSEGKKIQAKTTSSLGSLYAYTGQKEKAEELFNEAINTFTDIDENDDDRITKAHMAHLLLDTEDIQSKKLLTALDQYFCPSSSAKEINPYDPKTWDHWLESILIECDDKEKGFNVYGASFYFWIWLKAITKLPAEKLNATNEFDRILSKHTQHLEILKVRSHPIEMIRKYHAILMLRLGNKRSVKKDLDTLDEIIRNNHDHGIIPLLCRIAIYEIKAEQGMITSEDITSLEVGAKKDIDLLYQDIRNVSNENITESLIDRLHHAEHLSMKQLKESIRYEFK